MFFIMGIKKKRNLSVFDAIQELESEDAHAETKRLKKSSTRAHRALAAQSQTKIYNHLVECRILMQRAVTGVSDDLGGEGTGSSIDESCNSLLEMLLQARQKLIAGDPGDEDDENEYSEMVQSKSDDQLQETLQQEYETCREEWKEVLNRRHKDLKLHAGLTAKSQFRVMDSTFWQQVEGTMEYEQIHRKDNDETKFDDSKVYQQLLKEFVANSASNSGKESTRIKQQRSAQNNKKKVDRKASKGRKLRYKEMPKLVNFTFPLSRPNMSNLNQDEWFQSLFGGAGKM